MIEMSTLLYGLLNTDQKSSVLIHNPGEE